MAGKISLPHQSIVTKWKEEKVIKWLKRVHLDDCIPAFETRHIDGTKLLELNEQKLFTYQDLKIKYRKQIAKCVQECKAQASNAKRMARTIKQQSRGSTVREADSNGAYESDDSNDWGSDFEDDSEDELQNETSTTPELNNNTLHNLGHSNIEFCCPTQKPSSKPVLEYSQGKSIPKPPDVPVISKNINSLSGPKSTTCHIGIPRPPSKRPPSQPPPPPIPQVSSQDEPQEEYEVPIGSSCLTRQNSSESSFRSRTSSEGTVAETYELIEPPEEAYEIVDGPLATDHSAAKPVLPPRNPIASSPPPPLPQKPRKLKDPIFVLPDKPDEQRSFVRPRLGESPVPETSALERLGMKISGSLLLGGREGWSSRSSSPEKDANTSDERRSSVSSLLPNKSPSSCLEDTAQIMATRPLPPVPNLKEEKVGSKQQQQQQQTEEVGGPHSCPWFSEVERAEAEGAVRALGESGAFVVRPSRRAGRDNPFSLTVLHEGRLFHLNIRLRPDGAFALGREKRKEKTFPTVADLVAHHQREPILLTSRGEPAGRSILSRYPEKPLS